MATNIEVYEALRRALGSSAVGEEAAKVVAESIPQRDELATKADIHMLKQEMSELKADMRGWMLSFFVPLWIGVYGTLAAVVVSIVVR